MLTKRELDGAIKECENAPTSYQNCAKLATFYTILDHLYSESKPLVEQSQQIDDYGESEFLQLIKGKDMQAMWLVMDELMTTLQAVNPRLYNGVMRMIEQAK